MAYYRPYGEGLYQLDTPAGALPVSATEEQLRAAGHEPDLRLALNDAGGAGGQGNVPESRADVPPSMGGPGSGGGGAPNFGAGGGTEGAPPVPVAGGPGAPPDKGDRPERKARPEDKGAREETVSVTVPDSAAQSRGKLIPGKDVRAGYTVERSGSGPLSQQDRDTLDASEREVRDEKQREAEERSARVDARNRIQDVQLGDEERALSAREVRAREWRNDYEARQAEIDHDRESIDKMEVDPKKLFHDKGGTAALIGAALQIIGGAGVQAGYRLDHNPGQVAVDKAISDSVDRQKEQIARRRGALTGKENELARRVKLYGDPDLAEASLRADMSAWAQRKGEALFRESPEDVRSSFRTWHAENQKKTLLERRAIDDAHADKVRETWVYQPAHYSGGSGAGLKKGQSVPSERTEKIVAYANGIAAANRIQQGVNKLGAGGDTWDNPTEGVIDRAKNLVSSDRKRDVNQLDADTGALARGLQQSLGKSDNDARLADEMAKGSGSGSDRVRAANDARTKMLVGIRAELSTLTGDQQQELLRQMPPDVQRQVLGAPAPASEPDR